MRIRKLAAVAAIGAATLVTATPAEAYPAPGPESAVAEAGVVNTEGGVYWRASPHENDYQAIAGYGEYDGYTVALECWAWGDPVGPYGNTLWYFAEQYYPQPPQGDGQGWINDHYLDTPGTAASPEPIGPECNGY